MTAPVDLVRRRPVACFLTLTFLITWVCSLAVAAGQAGLLPVQPSILWMAFVGQFGPVYAALILTATTDGRRGIRKLASRLALRRGLGTPWAWFALLVFGPGVYFAAYAIDRALGGRPAPFGQTDWAQFALTLVGGSLAGLLFGGLTEEPGWRGYLLPRLQTTLSPLTASLLVGTIWAFWHLDPAVLARGLSNGAGVFWTSWTDFQAWFLPGCISFAILMTAVYNRTGGSLAAMMVMHSVSNAWEMAIPASWRGRGQAMAIAFTALEWLVALGLLALSRRWPTAAEAGVEADTRSGRVGIDVAGAQAGL